MMSSVGEIEKKTEARVVALFRERLQYDYLGDRADRANRANSNIDATLLIAWCRRPPCSAQAMYG